MMAIMSAARELAFPEITGELIIEVTEADLKSIWSLLIWFTISRSDIIPTTVFEKFKIGKAPIFFSVMIKIAVAILLFT
jgi:hypothetical protein|tara:strand:+ start:151 stop:387 length:237 start_codon:yes stop_codon:yes gene_type:complete